MSRSILGKLSMGAIALAVAWAAGNANAQCVQGDSGVECKALLAGQHINVGTVCVEVVGDDLVITYTTTGGWTLEETHTWAGDLLSKLPQNKAGNPVPGQFPYKSGSIAGSTSYSVTIPLSILGFQCGDEPDDDLVLYVATHAVVRNSSGGTETAWGEGSRIVTKGNWATYFTVTLTCDCDEAGGDECTLKSETAWAYDAGNSKCFADFAELNAERWGWSIGPLPGGTEVFDLYAGAGQCDQSKGTWVGTVTVSMAVNGIDAEVEIQVVSGFSIEEGHAYIGADPLPIKCTGPSSDPTCGPTVAPGQLGTSGLQNVNDPTYLKLTVPLVYTLDGKYALVHAVVRGCYNQGSQ